MEKNKNYESLFSMVKADDLEFYEKFLQNLTEDEFANFMEENPDFFATDSER